MAKDWLKAADCLLKRGIGKCLKIELEQYFLFRFHDAGTRMGNAFNGFQCRFVAAGVQIYLNEIVAYHFGILGVWGNSFRISRKRLPTLQCRVGRFVNAQGSRVIGNLFFYFHIGIGGGSLFKKPYGLCSFRPVAGRKVPYASTHFASMRRWRPVTSPNVSAAFEYTPVWK